jgi:hypothetical protein
LTSVCERCGGKREKEDRRNELREEKNSLRGEEDDERKKEGLRLEARMLEKDSPTNKRKEQ